MSEQSEQKTVAPVITTKQDAPNEVDQGKGELSETDLAKVNGGIGSASSGAGKVTFNPFSITRK